MRQLFILFALLLILPAATAKKREKFPDRETLEFHRPWLVIDDYSVWMLAPFNLYGKLGGNQAWHHFTITLALEADTTVSKQLLVNNFRSTRLEKRLLRERGERRDKQRTGKFKTKSNYKQEMSLRSRIYSELWMQEPLVVIVRQYHSNKYNQPLVEQPEQILKPLIVDELPEPVNPLW